MAPWSAGSFSRTNGDNTGEEVWQDDKADGDKIVASRHDTHDQDLATGVNTCLAKDGQNAATANLPMGGYLHTNVGNATARTHYAKTSQVQDGSYLYFGSLGGTATAMTGTLAPAITAYAAGQLFHGLASAACGIAATLNLNGVGAVNIQVYNATTGALRNTVANDFLAGQAVAFMYSGTTMVLLNQPLANWGTNTSGSLLGLQSSSIIGLDRDGSAESGVLNMFASDLASVAEAAGIEMHAAFGTGKLILYGASSGSANYVEFWPQGTRSWLLETTAFYPFTSGTKDLGLTTNLIRTIYTQAVNSTGTALTLGTVSAHDVNIQLNNINRYTFSSGGNFLHNSGGTSLAMVSNTSDGADNGQFSIGGGGVAGSSRGSFIDFYGNEHASTGILNLSCGNVSGALLKLNTPGTQSIQFLPNGTLRYSYDSNGNFVHHSGGTALGMISNSSDGADNGAFSIAFGGAASTTRGALIEGFGNEHASTGILSLTCGNISGAAVNLKTAGSQPVDIYTNGAQAASFLGADRHLKLFNATGVPGTPSGGGILYVDAGGLRWIGQSGTNTLIAAA